MLGAHTLIQQPTAPVILIAIVVMAVVEINLPNRVAEGI